MLPPPPEVLIHYQSSAPTPAADAPNNPAK
jgi:hypothetical protein